MLAALEAGAEDFAAEDEAYEITTEPDQYEAVRSALEQQGFVFLDVSLGPVPVTWTALTDPDMTAKMEKLIEKLEEHDDVQEVYHNWEQG